MDPIFNYPASAKASLPISYLALKQAHLNIYFNEEMNLSKEYQLVSNINYTCYM